MHAKLELSLLANFEMI